MPDDVERALRSITQSPQLQPADEGITGMRTSIDAANAGRYQTYNLVQNLEADVSPPPQVLQANPRKVLRSDVKCEKGCSLPGCHGHCVLTC
jgi:hypothetical protein